MNNSTNQASSLSLIRLIGYGLLIISLIHIIDIFIPLKFTNPTWEFSITALLLERVPLPLVGLTMVFWGGTELRGKLELLLLKVLSWFTLIVGILCLLLIPLGISATVRLNEQAVAQLGNQYEQQIVQLDQAQSRLDSANAEELNNLLEAFRAQNPAVSASTPQFLKNQLLEEVNQARQNAAAVRQNAQREQRLGLQKNLMKWSLISVISAYLFIYIWHLTRWVRRIGLK